VSTHTSMTVEVKTCSMLNLIITVELSPSILLNEDVQERVLRDPDLREWLEAKITGSFVWPNGIESLELEQLIPKLLASQRTSITDCFKRFLMKYAVCNNRGLDIISDYISLLHGEFIEKYGYSNSKSLWNIQRLYCEHGCRFRHRLSLLEMKNMFYEVRYSGKYTALYRILKAEYTIEEQTILDGDVSHALIKRFLNSAADNEDKTEWLLQWCDVCRIQSSLNLFKTKSPLNTESLRSTTHPLPKYKYETPYWLRKMRPPPNPVGILRSLIENKVNIRATICLKVWIEQDALTEGEMLLKDLPANILLSWRHPQGSTRFQLLEELCAMLPITRLQPPELAGVALTRLAPERFMLLPADLRGMVRDYVMGEPYEEQRGPAKGSAAVEK